MKWDSADLIVRKLISPQILKRKKGAGLFSYINNSVYLILVNVKSGFNSFW